MRLESGLGIKRRFVDKSLHGIGSEFALGGGFAATI